MFGYLLSFRHGLDNSALLDAKTPALVAMSGGLESGLEPSNSLRGGQEEAGRWSYQCHAAIFSDVEP
jgi:hypothetical protein